MVNNSIYSIKSKVLTHKGFADKQYIITLAAKVIADNFIAGQFVHIECDKSLLMRRPLSIMSVDKNAGTIDLLYKIVGDGTKLLSYIKVGTSIGVIGPIGNGFNISSKKTPLLLGGGVGMPPMIAIAQQIKDNNYYKPVALLASEVEFPFNAKLSSIAISKKLDETNYTMPLLEDWGIACRLASLQGYKGVYQGYITELAAVYLDSLSKLELAEVEIYACGPSAMLRAVAKLALKYKLDAQVSLEEYMACAIGGCAGCVVEVNDYGKKSMQRVCVDGPVFAAKKVFNV